MEYFLVLRNTLLRGSGGSALLSYRAAITTTATTNGSGLVVPAAAETGDLAIWWGAGNKFYNEVPSGFTEIRTENVSTDYGGVLAYKILSGSETTIIDPEGNVSASTVATLLVYNINNQATISIEQTVGAKNDEELSGSLVNVFPTRGQACLVVGGFINGNAVTDWTSTPNEDVWVGSNIVLNGSGTRSGNRYMAAKAYEADSNTATSMSFGDGGSNGLLIMASLLIS